MIIFFKDPEPEKFKTTIDILQPLINDHNQSPLGLSTSKD